MRIVYAVLFLLCLSGIVSCEKNSERSTVADKPSLPAGKEKSLPPSEAAKSSLPQAAKEFAKKHGCEPIPDLVFYDEFSAWGFDPRSEDFKRLIEYTGPQFVQGYATGKGITPEDSIVFWCRKKKSTKDMLIVEFNRKKEIDKKLLNCPSIIREQISIASGSGLSLLFDDTMDLGKFYNVAKKEYGPKNVTMTHNAIRSGDEETAKIFYCYKGDWLSYLIH